MKELKTLLEIAKKKKDTGAITEDEYKKIENFCNKMQELQKKVWEVKCSNT